MDKGKGRSREANKEITTVVTNMVIVRVVRSGRVMDIFSNSIKICCWI